MVKICAMHTAPYFTAFGLLTVLHSWRVIQLRRHHRIAFGHGGNEDLERLNRVLGNHTEYVPIGLLLLVGLEFVQAPVLYMHACGLLLLTGRLLHAFGLGRTKNISKPRFFGMILTFASLLLASIGVSLFSILGPMP